MEFKPLKLDTECLELSDLSVPIPRALKHVFSFAILGKPRPKARIRHFIAGKWGKWKPSESLKQLTSFLRVLRSYFIEPSLPAEDLKQTIKGKLNILPALDDLPEGKPKVVGFTPTDTAEFEQKVADACKKYEGEILTSRIAIFFRFIFSSKVFVDVDNIEKAVIDGIVKGGIVKNDRQVEIHLSFRDYKAGKLQATVVKIYEVTDF